MPLKSMNNTQKYWFKNKINKCNSAILIKINNKQSFICNYYKTYTNHI